MDITSICRAYVDLVVNITEEELNQIGFNIGDDKFLETAKFQPLIDKYIKRGKIVAGGPAANTMAMIALLGGKAAFIGKVANDELGDVFSKDFEKRGVTFNINREHEKGTAGLIIFVTPDGERTIAYNPRIADEITKEDIKLNKSILENSKFIYIGLIYRGKNTTEIINLAKQYGKNAKIVMSLQSYENGNITTAKYLLKSDIILGNKVEFNNLLLDLESATLEELSKSYPNKIFACTLGTQGATIVSNAKTIPIPAIPVKKVIDTTGAGDAWAGGFLYGLSHEETLEEAGKLGAKSAVKILTEAGARVPNN